MYALLQARYYRLHGIQPVTMTPDPVTLMVTYKPTSEWDEHTKRFAEKLVNNATVMYVCGRHFTCTDFFIFIVRKC